jgi:hypothetical protein
MPSSRVIVVIAYRAQPNKGPAARAARRSSRTSGEGSRLLGTSLDNTGDDTRFLFTRLTSQWHTSARTCIPAHQGAIEAAPGFAGRQISFWHELHPS